MNEFAATSNTTMSNDTLTDALQQNRRNIKRLLDAVGADHDLPNDPERDAKAAAIFDPDTNTVDEADLELSEGDRIEWLFRTNAEALEAAAEAAAGDADRSVISESDSMKAVTKGLGGETETDRKGALSDVEAALSGGQE